MADHGNLHWSASDGLRLHARDHAGGGDGRPAILCLPGPTRNARDFEALARRLSPVWRVIAVDFRGRGESAHDRDPMHYVPQTYANDIRALCTAIGLGRFVAVGSSLGGLVAMLLASDGADIAGTVLNDVGPDIEPAGVARIRGQAGRGGNFPTWLHAARALADANREVYPKWGLADWLTLAKRVYRLSGSGRIVPDHDARIAEPFRGAADEAAPDWWSAYAALARAPVAVIRGGRSDILAQATAVRMVEAAPDATLAVVPDVGHAPTLDEPEAVAAIDALLARVVGEPAPA